MKTFLLLLISLNANAAGKIVNADIAPSGTANIALNKLAASTAHNAATFNSSGFLATGVAPSSAGNFFQSNGTDWVSSAPGNLTDAGTDGIVVTSGLASVTNAGVSLAQHVADTTHNGYLSSTDWNTFNGKQAAITLAANSVVFTDGSGHLVAGGFIGDVTNNSSTVTISPGVVTNAKLANMNSSTIKCNISQSSGTPTDCTMAQVSPALSVFLGDSGSGGQVGAVPAPPVGATGQGKFLMANGGYSVPQIPITPSTTYGAVISSTGTGWQASTIAIPACAALAGTVVDWSLSNCFTKKLSANTTLTFINRVAGQSIMLRVTNTASNYTLTFPSTDTVGNSVLWSGSTIPVLTTGARSDIFTIFYDGTEMYGNPTQNYGTH